MKNTEHNAKSVAPWYVDVIRTLSKDRGWTKHKVKSIRGQVIAMKSDMEREEYLRTLIRRGK